MATAVWALRQALREIARTGREEEIRDVLALLRDRGRVPPGWFHRETPEVDACGPPGSTVRVYSSEHAGQFVVLGAGHGKAGRGKLPGQLRRTLGGRLRAWRQAYPEGRQS